MDESLREERDTTEQQLEEMEEIRSNLITDDEKRENSQISGRSEEDSKSDAITLAHSTESPSKREDEVLITHLAGARAPDEILISSAESNLPPIAIPNINLHESKSAAPETQHETLHETQHEAYQEIQVSEDELKQALSDLVSTSRLNNPDIARNLKAYIKKKSIEAIMSENYDEAEKLQKAEKVLGSATGSVFSEEGVTRVHETLQQRHENIDRSIENCKEKWKQRLDAFAAQKDAKMTELKTQQEKELQDFEEQCQNEKFLIQFQKPSSTLLQYRTLQRNRALAKDFIGAKEFKTLADDLQAKESIEASRRATRAVQAMYNKLINKHDKEIECAKQNWKRQQIQLEQEMKKEISSLETSKKLLERKTNDNPRTVWSRAVVFSPTRNSPSRLRIESVPTTPRSRKNFIEYRNSNHQSRLPMNTLDVSSILTVPSKKRPKTSDKNL